MSTVIVGDVQGCYEELRALMDRAGFRPGADQLWLAGDLVNRGPASLEVLRWVRSLGDSARPVLGNHELHLLGIANGVATERPQDTLRSVLDAPDAAELIDWVRGWPLLAVATDDRVCMVHAGLPPQWDLPQAEAQARRAEAWLRTERCAEVLTRPNPEDLDPAGSTSPAGEVRRALAYFTRMRVCDERGVMDLRFKGPPEAAPRGTRPWFTHRVRAWAGHRVVFGHWSALDGHTGTPDSIALDTGCVWGRSLTALRLEDGALFSQPCSSCSLSTDVE